MRFMSQESFETQLQFECMNCKQMGDPTTWKFNCPDSETQPKKFLLWIETEKKYRPKKIDEKVQESVEKFRDMEERHQKGSNF